MSPHLKRWITGIIAAPIVFAVIIYDGHGSDVIFVALVMLLILGALSEYNSMVLKRVSRWEKCEVLALSFLIPTAVYLGDTRLELAIITFSAIFVFLVFLFRLRNDPFDSSGPGKVVFGFIYIPLMMSYLIPIRGSEDGMLWIFFILILAISGDMSAFYVGKTVGKRKLMPHISPGKTIEGTIGLLCGGMTGCIIFKLIFFHALSFAHVLIIGFAGSILGQLGDLCESTIKRAAGVKDSGSLLPGHGGILDRLDSLLFIIPFVYYYNMFVIR
jgi:phosphatidate cytidylyltransferase